MEVVGERHPPPPPPPLPPKTRIGRSNFSPNQSIIVRNEVPSKESFSSPVILTVDSSQRDDLQSGEKSPRTLSKFANGSDSRRSRGFGISSESGGPKIITWAQNRENSFGDHSDSLLSINSFYKSSEPEKDDEFLYQNVSSTGTNYIEYKLNGIINKGITEKVKNTKNQNEKSFDDGRSMRRRNNTGNRQIEVRQIKNKTVVKISIKDDESWKNGSESHLRPVKLDRRQSKERDIRHKNCDENGKEENSSSEDQLYANLNASDPECDQAYENQSFHAAKTDRTAEKSQASEQVYENQMFGSDESTYENVTTFGRGPTKNAEATKPSFRVSGADEHLQKGKNRKVVVTISSLQPESEESQPKKAEFGDGLLGHKRAESLTSSGVGVDSDGEESNISCDSLNSNELNALSTSEDHGYHTPNSENKTGSPVDGVDYQNINIGGDAYENTKITRAEEEIYENFRVFEKKKTPPPPPPKPNANPKTTEEMKSLPKGLLRDIQSMNVKLSACPKGEKVSVENEKFGEEIVSDAGKNVADEEKRLKVEEKTYEERKKAYTKSEKTDRICAMDVDTDQFYKFHLFENRQESNGEKSGNEEETFAGVKDYLNREKQAAIKSAKGTIRGVKNRVKAGIATFLQMQENKTYKDRDAGKIVVYSTTMGIVRETYHKCLKVKQILRTLMVKFEERDVFMSTDAQDEIRERMKCEAILVPQVFVEGQHVGDAETIERLNESGELRKILKPYKSPDACATCQVCGGYRLLPCSICKGSKKSIHRNHFTAEFVALKCMNCDQVGLTKCYAC